MGTGAMEQIMQIDKAMMQKTSAQVMQQTLSRVEEAKNFLNSDAVNEALQQIARLEELKVPDAGGAMDLVDILGSDEVSAKALQDLRAVNLTT